MLTLYARLPLGTYLQAIYTPTNNTTENSKTKTTDLAVSGNITGGTGIGNIFTNVVYADILNTPASFCNSFECVFYKMDAKFSIKREHCIYRKRYIWKHGVIKLHSFKHNCKCILY